MGAKTVSSTNVTEQLDIHMLKSESGHRSYSLHEKLTQSGYHNLHPKCKNVKVLKDNVGEN